VGPVRNLVLLHRGRLFFIMPLVWEHPLAQSPVLCGFDIDKELDAIVKSLVLRGAGFDGVEFGSEVFETGNVRHGSLLGRGHRETRRSGWRRASAGKVASAKR
jgi:hypothetical protein